MRWEGKHSIILLLSFLLLPSIKFEHHTFKWGLPLEVGGHMVIQGPTLHLPVVTQNISSYHWTVGFRF